MEFLTKLFDFVKASGLQTAMLAAATVAYIWAERAGHVPKLEGAWAPGVYLFGFAMAGLSCASALGWLLSILRASTVPLKRWFLRRKAKASFVAAVPHLGQRERQILGFLRHYGMRTFETDFDGGHAASLLALGYIRHFGQVGQRIDPRRVPTIVSDHVWEVINSVPESFPHEPEFDGRTEIEPWRMHWMLR